MPARRTRKTLWLAWAVFPVVVGCGSTVPPCETNLADVDGARGEARAAEERLADAERRKADLERRLAAEEQRKRDLERRRQEAERKIAELGG